MKLTDLKPGDLVMLSTLEGPRMVVTEVRAGNPNSLNDLDKQDRVKVVFWARDRFGTDAFTSACALVRVLG